MTKQKRVELEKNATASNLLLKYGRDGERFSLRRKTISEKRLAWLVEKDVMDFLEKFHDDES
jgi:hypothetical protein